MNIRTLKTYHKILILGFGKEGKAVEKFLSAVHPHAEIGIADQQFDPNYLQKQSDYDLVIKTPGIPKQYVTVPYTTATNIFFANTPGVTIGITGSKGKSTTSALIHHILTTAKKDARFVGNIGNPLLTELLENPDSSTYFVCELSSYQLDDIEYSPHISVITSLFPEHMNYHKSIPAYYQAKKNILSKARQDDYFVYNPKFPVLADWAKSAQCISLMYEQDKLFEHLPTRLLGEHNKDNIRAAVTVAKILSIPRTYSISAIETFAPLPHRLEYIGTYQDIAFYDDAISTTPESTIAALETIQPVGTILLGGENRGYDFSALVQRIAYHRVRHAILFPDSGAAIQQEIQAQNLPIQLFETSNMKDAVAYAYAHTPKNTACLLSTASPSYSLWKNFEEKGNAFQHAVKLHAKKNKLPVK